MNGTGIVITSVFAAALAAGLFSLGYDAGRAKCLSNFEKEKKEIKDESIRTANELEELKKKRLETTTRIVERIETVVDESGCMDAHPPRDIIDGVREHRGLGNRPAPSDRVPTAAG